MDVRRSAAAGTALALCVALVAACGEDDPDSTLTVYAAASLTAAFTEIGEEFERRHEGVEVEFSFSGSSDLVAQLQEGAPADVFASADQANMDKLTADDLHAGDPQPFASNTLEIATPPDNPAGISTFADLGEDGVRVVVCAPVVPCGAAAAQAQEATGVRLRPVSEEQSVTDVLGKVTSGEADAGLVYVTDVTGAGDAVEGIAFPESSEIVNTYPIVALEDSDDPGLAEAFVALVMGDEGRAVLEQRGFGAP
jgi:molybdate transport system substrate-binding protein